MQFDDVTEEARRRRDGRERGRDVLLISPFLFLFFYMFCSGFDTYEEHQFN